MEKNHEEKKEEIIKWLKEFKRLSSSRFVGLLGFEYDYVKKILEELENEGKILREEETNATYWILNMGNKNEI